jgi:hypothetical protein
MLELQEDTIRSLLTLETQAAPQVPNFTFATAYFTRFRQEIYPVCEIVGYTKFYRCSDPGDGGRCSVGSI